MEPKEIKDEKSREQVEAVLTMFKDFDIEMELKGLIYDPPSLHIHLQAIKPVRMHMVKGFEKDLCYALGIDGISIEAPIPGKSLVGITIPYEGSDPLYEEVKESVIARGKASTSFLQRKFGLGYSRAAKLMDELEEHGVVGQAKGSSSRDVLIKEDAAD